MICVLFYLVNFVCSVENTSLRRDDNYFIEGLRECLGAIKEFITFVEEFDIALSDIFPDGIKHVLYALLVTLFVSKDDKLIKEIEKILNKIEE